MLLVLVIALAVLALVGMLSLAALAAQRRGARPLRGRRVVVHTRQPDDRSLRGVIVHDGRDGLILEAAEYLRGDGGVGLDGRVHVPAEAVSFVQELP